jgi:hypothetical protein
MGYVLFVQTVVFAVGVLFIWLVARRRKNWARWIWLVVFIISFPFALPELSRLLRSGPVVATLVCVQNFAQIVALYLIFTGNARQWFANDPVGQISPAN